MYPNPAPEILTSLKKIIYTQENIIVFKIETVPPQAQYLIPLLEYILMRKITRIGAQCYKYTGRSDAYFFIHVQGPLEDSHFQTQLG